MCMGEKPLLCGLADQMQQESTQSPQMLTFKRLAAYNVLRSVLSDKRQNVTESQVISYFADFLVFSFDNAEECKCGGLVQATSKHKMFKYSKKYFLPLCCKNTQIQQMLLFTTLHAKIMVLWWVISFHQWSDCVERGSRLYKCKLHKFENGNNRFKCVLQIACGSLSRFSQTELRSQLASFRKTDHR